MTMPAADIHATYENAAAICPSCGARNVFNRQSDLKNLRPIAHASVACESCKAPFDINGDVINPAHEMLLLDCRPFFDGKQYMQAVLGIAQAYEVFFDHFLHVQLAYRPGRNATPDELNALIEQLHTKVERFTFEPMRRLFLRLAAGPEISTIEDATSWVSAIPDRSGAVQPVPRAELEAVADEQVRDLLVGMADTTINVLRNKIVHKDAYRPTREESWAAHEEGSRLLFGLTAALGVAGSAEYYINGGEDE